LRETILVAGNHCVVEYEIDGTFVKTYGTSSGPRNTQRINPGEEEGATNAPALSFPFDIAVIPSTGEVAVASQGAHKIEIFDGESGIWLRSVGAATEGAEDGQLMSPCGLVCDAHDQVREGGGSGASR
jgi:hypothetical protein